MAALIEEIKSRSSSINAQRNVFLLKLERLNSTLAESLNGIDLYARSAKESLEIIGVDDWIYGYLVFSQGRLEVRYRSTEDDYQDFMNQVPEEYQSYQSKELKLCPITWLEKLSSEAQINRILSEINTSLEYIEKNTTNSLESLNKALDSQSEEIANETTHALREVESDELIRYWIKARSCIQLDPEESITRSSSYLESVCRLILNKLEVSLPDNKDITSLIGAAVRALELSENSEANRDLQQLFGGIKSIFQSIGAMRTHFGTAHGITPGDYAPKEDYARLINDAAATASTYLLRRFKKKMTTENTAAG